MGGAGPLAGAEPQVGAGPPEEGGTTSGGGSTGGAATTRRTRFDRAFDQPREASQNTMGLGVTGGSGIQARSPQGIGGHRRDSVTVAPHPR